MDCITHGPHHAWTAQRVHKVWLKEVPYIITLHGSQGMAHIKYARPSASGFVKQIFNLQKLDIFLLEVVLYPGHSVNWPFGNWTFCILDVLYPRRSVTGRLVTGGFVTGRYVTGSFVGVPVFHIGAMALENI
jgi:hypothetical protein